MDDWRSRVVYAIGALIAIVFVFSYLYQWSMIVFEGESRSFMHSVQVVIEILTTAGFGGDSQAWRSPAMNAVIIFMNLSGVLLVFLALPLFVFPMLRQVLERSPPTTTDLTDHVIICGYSPLDEVLTEELDDVNIPYLYIESNRERVFWLIEQGVPAILGDAEDIQTFRNANAKEAYAIVADINDEVNPTIILSAKRVNPDVRTISVVRSSHAAQYHRLAGADEIVEALEVLGESLGTRAVSSFAEKFRATVEVDTELELTELLVEENSSLVGQTLRNTAVFREMGTTVLGGWFDGKFLISPPPDTKIEANTILLVAGHFEDVQQLRGRKLPTHLDDPGRVIICGYGVVGTAVQNAIEEYDIETAVIDRTNGDDIDVIGDVTNPATLAKADLNNARAVVLALDKDTTTIFTTLMINDQHPEIEIIARVHNVDNVWKVYNAGADFALSMSTITGKMIASQLIEDQEILIPQTEFEFLRTKAPALTGQTLAEAHIRAETGCTVVAIERGDDLITDMTADFTLEADDVLIAAGGPEATEHLIKYTH